MQYHPPSWFPASENGKRTDYYAHLRAEVIEAIPEGCAVVLDVGCGKGTLGRWLKEQPGVTTVYGAELFPAAGEEARRWLDDVVVGNIEHVALPFPEGTVEEVAIEHPSAPALAELGLRWYTVPAVSSMVMTIGGIEYPCAPFNGFYMASEIASRNFADESRYDQMHAAARALGIESVLLTDAASFRSRLVELGLPIAATGETPPR